MTSEPDIKDEIDLMFKRRARDEDTFWPIAEDAKRGHPYDECVCGHDRQSHGFKAEGKDDSLGRDHCNCLTCVDPQPGDPNQSPFRSCRCRRFVMRKGANE